MAQKAQTIPAGYKQTEIGVIPVDWDVKKLGKSCEKITTGKLDANAMKKDGEYRFYTCAKEYYFIDKYAFDTEALLVSGNGANVGYIHYYKGKFNAYQRTYVLSDFKENIFFTKLLLDKNLKERIRTEVNAGNTPYITMGTLTEMNIAYPKDHKEQTAIATVLSDTDALIEKLERLIAKKKAIKQGAMQQLLTGKRRLPGFSGDWEVKKLGEIAEIYQPETIAQDKFSSEGYLVYGANGIVGKYKKYNHENWQTIITCRGSTCGTVNKTIDRCWITGNAMVMNIDQNKKIDKLFFYYLLSRQDFKNCITGSGQPQIVRKPLFEYQVNIPLDKPEQTAIATVLSDMDAEIEALEKKVAKYRHIKTGMMQQLLTGKIRLV